MTEPTGTFRMYPSSAGSSAWRGLQLQLDTQQSVASSSSTIVSVHYDLVDFDTDAIVSTGSNSFLGVTIPAGAAGVVPAGMAGLWRLSSTTLVKEDSSDNIDFDLYAGIMANGDRFLINQDNTPRSIGDLSIRNSASMILGPNVSALAEGDVVWTAFISVSEFAGGGRTVYLMDTRTTWLLMEYLGPTP